MSTLVAVVDDHPLYRRALAELAAKVVGADGVFEANSVDGLLHAHGVPRVILLDFRLSGRSGVEAIAFVRDHYALATVVVVSASEDRREVAAALRAGASAFVSKATGLEELTDIVRKAVQGQAVTASGREVRAGGEFGDPLTARQLEILSLLCQGHSNKEISLRLAISLHTVKSHVAAVFKVLGVVSRTQAVLAARRLGIG